MTSSWYPLCIFHTVAHTYYTVLHRFIQSSTLVYPLHWCRTLHCVLQYCQVVWMAVSCVHIALKPTLTSFIRQLNGWNRLLNPILSTIQTIHLHSLTPDITPCSGMLSVICHIERYISVVSPKESLEKYPALSHCCQSHCQSTHQARSGVVQSLCGTYWGNLF